jgi:hypothetical protein
MANSLQLLLKNLELQGFTLHFTHSPDGWLHEGLLLLDAVTSITEYWWCPYTDEMVHVHGVETPCGMKGIGLWYRGC